MLLLGWLQKKKKKILSLNFVPCWRGGSQALKGRGIASMENPDLTAHGATALWINLFD